MKQSLALFALLSGCAAIDYNAGPVPGLEHMTVEEHYIDANDIYQRCSRCGMRKFSLPLACTCINFADNRAVIWLPRNASIATIEHERAHGHGFDHPDGELRERYEMWLSGDGPRVNATERPPSRGQADAESQTGIANQDSRRRRRNPLPSLN
jgi:hypothetical protein